MAFFRQLQFVIFFTEVVAILNLLQLITRTSESLSPGGPDHEGSQGQRPVSQTIRLLKRISQVHLFLKITAPALWRARPEDWLLLLETLRWLVRSLDSHQDWRPVQRPSPKNSLTSFTLSQARLRTSRTLRFTFHSYISDFLNIFKVEGFRQVGFGAKKLFLKMLEVIFAKPPKFFPKNLSLEVLSLYFVSALLCAKFGQNATKLAIFLSCDNKA